MRDKRLTDLDNLYFDSKKIDGMGMKGETFLTYW